MVRGGQEFSSRRGINSPRYLGGDRVILSEDLRDALILGGRIAPYRRAYARRRPKAPAIIYRDELFSPLPVLAAPVRPKPAPRKRERHELPTLPLSCPPTIADMLAGLGPTHETIAQQVGLSRPQVTNVIVGGSASVVRSRGASSSWRGRHENDHPKRRKHMKAKQLTTAGAPRRLKAAR